MPTRRPRRADWRRYERRLAALDQHAVNFDTDAVSLNRALTEGHGEADGWRLDRHEADLPPEPPGPPLDHGAFAAARGVLQAYDFPDPGLIRGLYVSDRPFEDRRVMLLHARFLGFSFWFGVQLTEVVDEVRETDDGPAHVWGYGYRTLEGHFEMGEILFTVWKWTESGRVAFRIDAISKTGRIWNPLYWLGFKLFGRYLQLRFARTALARMRALVEEVLASGPADVPLETPDVRPAAAEPEAAEQMAEAQSAARDEADEPSTPG